jgi:hypothetical protein
MMPKIIVLAMNKPSMNKPSMIQSFTTNLYANRFLLSHQLWIFLGNALDHGVHFLVGHPIRRVWIIHLRRVLKL